MPVPSCVRVAQPSTWRKRSNTYGRSSAAMPVPVSSTVSTTWSPAASALTRTFPPPGERERVREEVRQDALDLRCVDFGRQRRGGVDQERHAAALGARGERRADAAGEGREVGRPTVEVEAAGLQLGEVEELVDEVEQTARVPLHDRELVAEPRIEVAVAPGERVLDRPEQERQRRPELVADVGEEPRLEPVHLLQPLRLRLDLGVARLELGRPLLDAPLEARGVGAEVGLGRLERRRHRVEPLRQPPDLVPDPDRHRHVALARVDAPDAVEQAPDGPDEAPPHRERDGDDRRRRRAITQSSRTIAPCTIWASSRSSARRAHVRV